MTESTTSETPVPGNADVPKTVWPCVNYVDARAAIRFLTEAFGFVETLAVPGETEDVVVHAELRWPEGGGLMLGTANRPDSEFSQLPTSCASLYVVTDDPRGVFERATKAGAKVVREMRDEDYGSTGFSVADPEGNLWSFGTYRGEPLPE
jgi:uncharacterized glyoxalase superfamily protein PhnB